MKKHILIKCLIGILMVPLMVAFAHGASLTDSQVKRFIASMEEAQDLFDAHDDLQELEEEEDFDDFNEEIDMTMPKAPMSDVISEMKGHDIYNKLQGVVRKHGFSNVDQWAKTGDSVMNAFIALVMEIEQPDAIDEMKSALQEIEQNPHMGENQKQQMREMMESTISAMNYILDVPPAHKDAVRPHLDEFRRILEADEQ